MHIPFVTLLFALLLGGGAELIGSGTRPRPDVRNPASPFGYIPEPPTVVIRVGDPAPNFSFQGYDGEWKRLHHVLEQGPVLLVFGAPEPQLARLEQQRGALLDMGVIPVVVVDRNPSAARAVARRLGLTYVVLADHRQVIASQFQVVDVGRIVPAWFVIDQRGKVRGLQRGRLPSDDYLRACARALARPMPGQARPGSQAGGRR